MKLTGSGSGRLPMQGWLRPHSAGAKIIISHPPQVMMQVQRALSTFYSHSTGLAMAVLSFKRAGSQIVPSG